MKTQNTIAFIIVASMALSFVGLVCTIYGEFLQLLLSGR